jgi:integrating conjugative element protein (TIGR03749 family)
VGDSGALILLDIAAEPARAGQSPLEPVRIVDARSEVRNGQRPVSDTNAGTDSTKQTSRETPIPVVLTRYAAQNLYAPLRTVEPLRGVMRVTLSRDLNLDTLLPTLPVRASALAAWRLDDQWVTAVRLTHTGAGWLTLDPRALQGDILAATFQHDALGPKGSAEDTTVVYLVTRGRGLAASLLPAIARFDPAVNLPATNAKRADKEIDHAQ